jgi:hypothetical protein
MEMARCGAVVGVEVDRSAIERDWRHWWGKLTWCIDGDAAVETETTMMTEEQLAARGLVTQSEPKQKDGHI